MSQVVVSFQVEGMDCGACERRLQTVLGRLEGAEAVEADHITGRVQVRFGPSRAAAGALARAAAERIVRAGFTVTGQQKPGQEARP